MSMLKEPVTGSPAELETQVLFPEARTRRRRLRITTAVLTTILLAALLVGMAVGGVFTSPPRSGSGVPRAFVAASEVKLTSVEMTEVTVVGGVTISSEVMQTTLGSPLARFEDKLYDDLPAKSGLGLRTIQIGSTMYQHLNGGPAGARVCTTLRDKPNCATTKASWLETRLPPVTSTLPQPVLAGFRSGASYDPTSLFADLQRKAVSLADRGTVKLGSVRTTLYSGFLPAQSEKEITAAPIAEQAILRHAVPGNAIGQGFYQVVAQFKRVPVRIWVDRQGIVRKVEVTAPTPKQNLETPGPGEGRGLPTLATGVTTFTYSAFDQPVVPIAPASSQVLVLASGDNGSAVQQLAAQQRLQDAPYSVPVVFSARAVGIPAKNQLSVALRILPDPPLAHRLGTPVTPSGFDQYCVVIAVGPALGTSNCAAVPGTYRVQLTNEYSTKVDSLGNDISSTPVQCSGVPASLTLKAGQRVDVDLVCSGTG